MYVQVEKSKNNKRRAVANSVVQKKSNVQQNNELADNRNWVSRENEKTVQLMKGGKKLLELSRVLRNQQQQYLPLNQQQLFLPLNQQQPFLPLNQQQPFLPLNQQQLFLPLNQQQLFLPPQNQQEVQGENLNDNEIIQNNDGADGEAYMNAAVYLMQKRAQGLVLVPDMNGGGFKWEKIEEVGQDTNQLSLSNILTEAELQIMAIKENTTVKALKEIWDALNTGGAIGGIKDLIKSLIF